MATLYPGLDFLATACYRSERRDVLVVKTQPLAKEATMYFQLNKAAMGQASGTGEAIPTTWKEWVIAFGVNFILFGLGALMAWLD